MVGAEDATHLWYPEHFKILPQINDWSNCESRIKDGKRVPEGFIYSSGDNTEWMSREELAKWISDNEGKIGTI